MAAIYLLILLFILPLLCRVACSASVAAKTPFSDTPADSSSSLSSLNSTATAIFAVLVLSFLFTGFVAFYIRYCRSDDATGPDTRRTILPLYAAAAASRGLSRTGLDPAVINSFPIFIYSQIKHLRRTEKGELWCAVCVSEFGDDERLRLLPKCDHVFHPECIDHWLAFHATCPNCRANLSSTRGNESTQELDSRTDVQIHDNQIAISVDEINQRIDDTEPREQVRNFPSPHSTGHSLVRLGEEDCERYTLRLPDEVRRQVDQLHRGGMSGRLFSRTPPLISSNRFSWVREGGSR